MKSINSDVAYHFLRKRLLGGEYAAGQSLVAKTLAEAIGVNRVSVRDALRQLEADGLVTITARSGACVKSMELKEFREMCQLRLALESYAAGLAASNRSEADLREMSEALAAMQTLTNKIIRAPREEPLLTDLRKEDVRFHVAIMAAARNDLIKREILRLHVISRVVASPPPAGPDAVVERSQRDQRRRDVLASHGEIFAAIRRAASSAAKDAMERHIQDIIDHMLRAMARAEAGVLGAERADQQISYSA